MRVLQLASTKTYRVKRERFAAGSVTVASFFYA